MTQAGELIGGMRPAAMVEVTGGAFEMGSSQFYPEERPVHWEATVGPFSIERVHGGDERVSTVSSSPRAAT